MKIIDQKIINQLYFEAAQSNRKRSHYLLHDSHQDKVQRLLIGLVKGSVVEAHYHEKKHQWEMVFILEGAVQLNLHDEQGKILETLTVGAENGLKAIEIQPLEIHSLECISDNALLLEIKEGPFDSSSPKSFLAS